MVTSTGGCGGVLVRKDVTHSRVESSEREREREAWRRVESKQKSEITGQHRLFWKCKMNDVFFVCCENILII